MNRLRLSNRRAETYGEQGVVGRLVGDVVELRAVLEAQGSRAPVPSNLLARNRGRATRDGAVVAGAEEARGVSHLASSSWRGKAGALSGVRSARTPAGAGPIAGARSRAHGTFCTGGDAQGGCRGQPRCRRPSKPCTSCSRRRRRRPARAPPRDRPSAATRAATRRHAPAGEYLRPDPFAEGVHRHSCLSGLPAQ